MRLQKNNDAYVEKGYKIYNIIERGEKIGEYHISPQRSTQVHFPGKSRMFWWTYKIAEQLGYPPVSHIWKALKDEIEDYYYSDETEAPTGHNGDNVNYTKYFPMP
jgi:hypothetical protein